ncbi:MAG TPA: VOC family protein [Devosia sp.]|nr:VOC family protein [Devosia sp.]
MSYRLDHIALLVRDIDESLTFLIGVLGLAEIANPLGGRDVRWVEIGDGRRFHVQAGDISKVHVEKRTHFALTAGDFDAVIARFRAEGIDFSDMAGKAGAINTRPDGMRAVFLRDPTGYWFEINSPEGNH